MLTGLGQTATQRVWEGPALPSWTYNAAGAEREPKPITVICAEHGKPVSLLARGKPTVRKAHGGAGMG
jgi:hypothetical protein